MTDFVHWYPLREAVQHAPPETGVFQIRVADGLLDYPQGKSAMVHYGQATDLRDSIQQVAREHNEADFLCRHQSSEQPAVLLEFVLNNFERRFGTAPSWPTS